MKRVRTSAVRLVWKENLEADAAVRCGARLPPSETFAVLPALEFLADTGKGKSDSRFRLNLRARTVFVLLFPISA